MFFLRFYKDGIDEGWGSKRDVTTELLANSPLQLFIFTHSSASLLFGLPTWNTIVNRLRHYMETQISMRAISINGFF